jgi:hypothetical protein
MSRMEQPHERPVEQRRDQLLSLCHALGGEERELAILGEGNASANCGDGTAWSGRT